MPKFSQYLMVLSAVALPIFVEASAPVFSQEYQGCFLINEYGDLVDLSDICPSPAVEISDAEPTLGTGDIQATLRWQSVDDLDLAITDPNGDIVFFLSPSVASGGQLDVDANSTCIDTTSAPVENVFWPPGQAIPGQYAVTVSLYQRCAGAGGSIPYELTLLVNGTTQTYSGIVDEQNLSVTYPFSVE